MPDVSIPTSPVSHSPKVAQLSCKPAPDELGGMRTHLAAGTGPATATRALTGQFRVHAKTPAPPVDDRNPDTPDGARTKRYRREVRGLLAHSPGAQSVRVGRFDHGRAAAHSRADHASQRSNPGQLRSGPRRGSVRFLRTLVRRFGGRFDRVSLFERQGLWGWASGGETFKRFLPHTPSSNAPHSPALVAGIVNNVDGNGRIGARRPAGSPLVRVNPAAA